MEFIKNPNDMTVIFDQNSQIYESCVNVMCQNLEEIVTHITEFMVNLQFFKPIICFINILDLIKHLAIWPQN